MYTDIFTFAERHTQAGPAFSRTFAVHVAKTRCAVPLLLQEKYHMASIAGDIPDAIQQAEQQPLALNQQLVVGIQNKAYGEQVWFNHVRKSKPQSFKAVTITSTAAAVTSMSETTTTSAAFASSTTTATMTPGSPLQQQHAERALVRDPTNHGRNCDFCQWRSYSAVDLFGRIERRHAVTASNLFKYGQQHGLVLFKHHDPLDFTHAQLRDLLLVSHEWMKRAARQDDAANHPLFLWNCLARSGASQFHGHAQLLLNPLPIPRQLELDRTSATWEASGGGMWRDLLVSHAALGLVRRIRYAPPLAPDADDPHASRPSTAYMVINVAPYKDMHIEVFGDSVTDSAFSIALHVALRSVIDQRGACTFNVGIWNLAHDKQPILTNMEQHQVDDAYRPVVARLVSRGKLSSLASDFGGFEVMGDGSIGHTDPFELAVSVNAELEEWRGKGMEGGSVTIDTPPLEDLLV